MKLRLAPAAFGLLALGILASPAHAEQEFPATLRGHAVLPARTFIPAPADAPARP